MTTMEIAPPKTPVFPKRRRWHKKLSEIDAAILHSLQTDPDAWMITKQDKDEARLSNQQVCFVFGRTPKDVYQLYLVVAGPDNIDVSYEINKFVWDAAARLCKLGLASKEIDCVAEKARAAADRRALTEAIILKSVRNNPDF